MKNLFQATSCLIFRAITPDKINGYKFLPRQIRGPATLSLPGVNISHWGQVGILYKARIDTGAVANQLTST